MKITRIIFLIAGFITVLICSYFLVNKSLWGNIPLWLFLGLWVIVVFSRSKWIISSKYHLRWLLLSVISAVSLTIGFPPNVFFLGMALGFIPILVIEKEIFSINQKASPWLFWRYLFATFWLWNILATYWVANAALVAGLFANVVNALLMTIPWIIFHIICRKNFNWWRYVILACMWIMFEYIHSVWEISWPWLTLGNSLGTAYQFAQWYEYTGYFGGSIWIWALNIAGFYILSGSTIRKTYLTGIFLLIFIIPSLFSLYLYKNTPELGKEINVSIIQPNYEPHYEKFSVPTEVQVAKMFRLADSVIDKETKLILFPETILDPVNLDQLYARSPYMLELHELFRKAPNAYIIAGLGGYHTFSTPPDRPSVRESEGTYYEVYNAAVMLQPDTAVVQEYYKSKFVPGAEIFPYKNILPFLKPLVRKLGGTYEGFAGQPYPTNFTFDQESVAPIICYESIYGGYVAKYVRSGANLLAIMTNDGWWDDTPGYRQHLAIGRLRAIENRRDIIRSANTGISCFINQRGDVSQPTLYETDAAINGKVNLNKKTTFYTRHGDWILWIVWISGIGLIVLNYILYNKKK